VIQLSLTKPRDVRNAWLFWTALILIVSVIILLGNRRTVTGAYRGASMHWLQGENLYVKPPMAFLYLPQAAILFLPFAYLPFTLSEILWRLLTIGSFAVGVRRLATLSGRTSGQELFPAITLLSIAPAWSCARNGQMTLLMTAMMMLAVVDLTDRRWWRATLWLSLGLALKPLILVLILLAGALYRPMLWRLLVGLAIVFLFPFLTQRPEYVASQYGQCVELLEAAARLGIEQPYAHLFGMLKAAGIDVSEQVQTATRVVAAALTMALCWIAQRRCNTSEASVFLFALAACYLMLFNPRTENNTYAMLGPAIGAFCAQALLIERRWLQGGMLIAMTVAMVGSYEFGKLIAPGVPPMWLAPLAAVCFTAFLVFKLSVAGRRRHLHGMVAIPV